MNILAIPISILLMGATIYAISLAWEGGLLAIIREILEQSGPNPFLVSLIVVVISIPIHELVHLFVHPQFGRSNKSIIGLWLSRGIFYAHYEGVVSRNRFLSILAAPYLVLAWLPVIILALIDISVPIAYVEILVQAALINSALPAGDVLGFFLMVSQVPSSACVKNKGWKSYWKPGDPCEE
ncbi:MAG: DUF3267 domain-containing protein [Anaerolineales bacterium]